MPRQCAHCLAMTQRSGAGCSEGRTCKACASGDRIPRGHKRVAPYSGTGCPPHRRGGPCARPRGGLFVLPPRPGECTESKPGPARPSRVLPCSPFARHCESRSDAAIRIAPWPLGEYGLPHQSADWFAMTCKGKARVRRGENVQGVGLRDVEDAAPYSRAEAAGNFWRLEASAAERKKRITKLLRKSAVLTRNRFGVPKALQRRAKSGRIGRKVSPGSCPG